MKKLLIATSSFGSDRSILNILKKKFILIKNKSGKKLDGNSLSKLLKNVDYVIAGTEIYNKKILETANNLKIIFRFGSGIDNIDIDYCKKNNIKIKKIKIDLSTSVAELSLSLILNIIKKIEIFNSELKKGVWKKRTNNLLSGKTLGIIGFGKVGKKLVKITKGFQLKYIYYDIKKQKTKIEYNNLKDVFKKSDIISIHQSFIKNNFNYINKIYFNIAKKNLILINTSRGDVINENDLFNFLKKNDNAYAGLDVYQVEPYYDKLSKIKNIILTPHIGSYSIETRIKMERDVLNLINKNLF
jgi:D-3-phosphoglycerate dehydrogenase